MSLLIRREHLSDEAAIETLTKAAFLDAPHTSHTEQFIVNALRKAGMLSLSLVAEDSPDLIGHVAASPVVISDGTRGWYGLGPLSVVPGHQRRGTGAQLMTAALEALRNQGAQGCVLLGDPAYYSRFGFRPEPGLILAGVPPEYFQAISFSGSLPAGNVSYHKAFDARE